MLLIALEGCLRTYPPSKSLIWVFLTHVYFLLWLLMCPVTDKSAVPVGSVKGMETRHSEDNFRKQHLPYCTRGSLLTVTGEHVNPGLDSRHPQHQGLYVEEEH